MHITFLGDNDRFQIWNVGIKLIYIFLIFIYDKIQICDKGKLLSLRDGRVWTNLGGPLFLQGHDLVPKPKGWKDLGLKSLMQ